MPAQLTSARFRKRARQLRQISQEVQEPDWRNTLLELAQDLEDEAKILDENGET